MTAVADSFSLAFGSRRGLGALSAPELAAMRRAEAAAAFKVHAAYDLGPLRVATSTQPTNDGGQRTFAFLLDAEADGRLLAVSYLPHQESRYRMSCISREVAELCDIPRQYESVQVLASEPQTRAALIAAGIFTRERLLLDELALDGESLRFLAAAAPYGTQPVSDIWSTAGLGDPGSATLVHLQGAGLIAGQDYGLAPGERSVELTDDGRFVRDHAKDGR